MPSPLGTLDPLEAIPGWFALNILVYNHGFDVQTRNLVFDTWLE